MVNIHFYGFISYCEFLGGVTVTGSNLWDILDNEGPQCNSLFLQGFFNTFFCGNFCFSGIGGEQPCFIFDPVTGCSFVSNGGILCNGAIACPLVTFCFDPTSCPATVNSCLPGGPGCPTNVGVTTRPCES
jgi:hypothetical protein